MDEKISFQKYDLISPEQAMQLAIQEAYQGAPFVSPNPLVGCVIVDSQHRFLAVGYHERYGFVHAEINALQKLSVNELKDTQFYVTLEPCAHEGKTPSCAKTLAQYPIKKVVYGLIDPNPLVCGQGADILREAGIEVDEYKGPLKTQLTELVEVFLKNFKLKQTFIAAKVAASLDGQIALKSGESRWITSEHSRHFVHELRSWYDAVIVGRKTIELDNPSLNIRHDVIQKENKVIIIDPSAQILEKIKNGTQYKFTQSHKAENIFFAVSKKLSLDKSLLHRFQILEFSNLVELHQLFWQANLKSVFIEGGALTYSSFLQMRLVDRLHLFLAPQIIGAKNGLSWSSAFYIENLQERLVLKNTQTKKIGADLYMTGTF